MFPRPAFLAALTGVTIAVAAGGSTPTVSLLLPLPEDQTVQVVGSVINAQPDRTTYAIGCATSAPGAFCPIGSVSWTIVQGESTMSQSIQFVQDASTTYTQAASCKFNVKRSKADCDADSTANISGNLEISHFHEVLTEYQTAMSPVIITAAAEKLSATAGPSKTGDSTASTSTSSDPLGSLPTLTAKFPGFTGPTESLPLSTGASISASTPASAAAPTTTTKSGNVAGPRVTQNALLAGVAAAVGGGALLL